MERKAFYGGICAAALACGVARGVCKARDVEVSAGLDFSLVYLPPIVGAVAGASREALPFLEDGSPGFGVFLGLGLTAAGLAGAGIGAVVCEAAGYGLGYLAGKLF